MTINLALTGRIRDFFKANPSEELTRADMAVKFGYSERTVEDSIRVLKDEGAIVREMVFRAAPKGKA